MPTLNKLTCTILLPPTDTPLPEYRRKYLDSSVSVYVPVPEIPILQAAPAFNIQLRSEDEWLAPGLAMFVYIDGYYQCNRSKRTPLTGSSALELRVRQKEEKLAGGGGGFVGREWRWVQLDVEQANGVLGSHKDLQDHVGKIEVVVLRCDAEQAVAEGPRALASALNASAKAPSAKAPSVKAPSAKAPSAKAPPAKAPSAKAPPSAKASSAGFGGMMGLFDGACDFGLDGAGDPMPGTFPEFDINGRRYDPVVDHYRYPSSSLSTNGASYGASASSEYSDESHDLDGAGHNHPGVVLDKYGQAYALRVPYYNTSAARRPHRRSDASVGYDRFVQSEVTAPPLAQPRQQRARDLPTEGSLPRFVVGPDGVRFVDTWAQEQPQVQPTNRPLQYAKIITGPDGQQYIDVSDQQPPKAHTPVAATAPVDQRQTHASPRGAAHPEPTMEDQQAIPEGFVVVLDPKTGEHYAVPPNLAHKYAQHQQQQQHETNDDQQRPNTDTEHQRSIILANGDRITKDLGQDYRLVAAAVPHIPFIKKYGIKAGWTPGRLPELKRQIDEILRHRHFPNGDRIVPMHDPRYDEVPDSKTPTKKRPETPALANEKAPQQQAAYDDTALGRSWIDEAADEYADINKAWREERHKAKEERKKRHDERHKKMQEKEEAKKKDDENRHSSIHTGSTLSHWASTVTSERESLKDEYESQKEETKSQKSKESSARGWGNSNMGDASAPQAGGWDDSNNQNGTTPAADNTAQTPPNPPTDGHNDTQPPQEPFKPPPYHNHPQSASSRSSRSTIPQSTTTSSRTINPNAAIQPYFDVLHPNNPKTSNSKPSTHQTPIPRTPYVYPSTQAPHLSSLALGNRSHGVRAGKGAEYTHATLRPKYLDTMERPYAVFVFEYRSVEKLGEILGRRGEDLRGDMERVKEEVGMGVLMNMPKEKLVEELLRAKMNASGGGGGGAEPEFSPPAQQKATNETANWAATQQPWNAPPPAAQIPVFNAATATPSHHSHSKKSERKSERKPEETKPPTVAWTMPDVPAPDEGFTPVLTGAAADPATKW